MDRRNLPSDTCVFHETGEIAQAVGKLILDAQREVWLVSPYVSLAELAWLKRNLLGALRQGLAVHLVVRENGAKVEQVVADSTDLVAEGLDLRRVPDLHAKVYWSDQAAIVTSLNEASSWACRSGRGRCHG